MKLYLSLTFLFLSGILCAKDLPLEKIRSPRTIPSTGVIIHKQTTHFVDIEAPIERVWIGCSPTINPKGNVSFLEIEVEDADIEYSFGPRRAIHDVPTCLTEAKKYNEMLKNRKTVQVVGEASSISENVPPKRYENDNRPRRFTDKPKIISGFFTRLQAGDKCVAYFSDGCDLPKNYWANAIPLE